jgi:sulfur-oxidizing protein SoxY
MPQTRRQMMHNSAAVAALMAGLGLLPQRALAQAAWNKTAFETKTLSAVMKALGVSAPVESPDVMVVAEELPASGASVQLGFKTKLSGVKRCALLVEKNPNTLSAVFDLTDSVEPEVYTQVKMSETCKVYAVAMMSDGRVLYAQKEVKITQGGCGG